MNRRDRRAKTSARGARKLAKAKKKEKPALRLDLGCGPNKAGPEWVGVDRLKFGGKVDVVLNVGTQKWPWKDASVDEVRASHLVEHLEPHERVHFVNELYRVLKPGGQALLVTPHWNSMRAYGDLTHKWPPVCEMWFSYLNKAWRGANAPHNDDLEYTCDFPLVPSNGYAMRGDLMTKNEEQRQFALANYKEAAQDLITTLTKPVAK